MFRSTTRRCATRIAAVAAAVALGLGLGCSGMGEAFERGFDREFHDAFVERCAPTGSDEDHRRACACVADELVATRSPSELSFVDDAEIGPLATGERAAGYSSRVRHRSIERGSSGTGQRRAAGRWRPG